MASQESKSNINLRRNRNSPANRQVITRSKMNLSGNVRRMRSSTINNIRTRLRSVKARLEACQQRIAAQAGSADNGRVENLDISSVSTENNNNNSSDDSSSNVNNMDDSGAISRTSGSAAEESPTSSNSSPGTSGMSSMYNKGSSTAVVSRIRTQIHSERERMDRHIRRYDANGGNDRVGNSEESTSPNGNNNNNDINNSGSSSSSVPDSNTFRGPVGIGTGAVGFPLPITADLASLFECPVCFDYVLPPILQCQSGHLVCSNCRPKLSFCPTCRRPLGNIRNLAMEKVVNTVRFMCKYTSSGCSLSLNLADKTDHEEMCQFRHYPCPFPHGLCEWSGSFEQVIPHLMISHKSITKNKIQVEDIVLVISDVNQPGRAEWMLMQPCFGHTFMVILEKHDKSATYQRFYAILQLIGSRRQAELFTYKLELKTKGRKLTWESTPRSIQEGITSAIACSDCLVFDNSFAKFFIINGKLELNLKIAMVER